MQLLHATRGMKQAGASSVYLAFQTPSAKCLLKCTKANLFSLKLELLKTSEYRL